jgi:hypothetical protein
VGIFGRSIEAYYKFCNEDLFIWTADHDQEYVINTNKITGMTYKFTGHTDKSFVFLESSVKPNYLCLKINNYDLINDFTIENQYFKQHYKKIKEGLPIWSYNIWFMTPYARKAIQNILLCVELLLFMWTLFSLLFELKYNFMPQRIYLVFLSKIFNLSYLWSCAGKIYVLIKTSKRKIINLHNSG